MRGNDIGSARFVIAWRNHDKSALASRINAIPQGVLARQDFHIVGRTIKIMPPTAARDLLQGFWQIIVGHLQVVYCVWAWLTWADVYIDNEHIAAHLACNHAEIVIFEAAIEPHFKRMLVRCCFLVFLPAAGRWMFAWAFTRCAS